MGGFGVQRDVGDPRIWGVVGFPSVRKEHGGCGGQGRTQGIGGAQGMWGEEGDTGDEGGKGDVWGLQATHGGVAQGMWGHGPPPDPPPPCPPQLGFFKRSVPYGTAMEKAQLKPQAASEA